jgi:pimeloyl-ACP methyl ester carboxylesterase
VSHQAKVAGAIFLASTFGGGAETASTTWPFGLIDREDAMANFNLAAPTCRAGDGCVSGCTPADADCAKGLAACPGQQDPAIQDPFWAAIKARDPVGSGWGPQPSGLSRYPIVPRFDWNVTVTGKIEVPALVMNGLKDSVVPPIRSVEIYNSLASTSKVIVQLDCASHALLWEGCSGESCVAPHESVQTHVGDWILTGMVFASPGHREGSFETTAHGILKQTAAPYEPEPADECNER